MIGRLSDPIVKGVGMPEITAEDLIWQWLRNGWRYRVEQGAKYLNGPRKPEYVAQIKREMGDIVPADYCDYFALVSDIVRFAKDNFIPVGPGRGSSAASLVCWLLRITEVDPMLYGLMDFSRFIVPGRKDLPDIDIDFDDERRHLVREYAVQRYGINRVGNIGTFTKYKGKNSIDDVARVYQLPKADMEIVKGLIVERSGGDSRADAALADTFDMFPAAAEVLARHPKLSMATALEGNFRGMSVHAAGLVITNTPVSDVCAMYTRDAPGAAGKRGEKITAVAVNKYDAEYVGLMKVDLLGLSTMGMIRIALDYAGLSLEDLYRIPTDDPATIKAFTDNEVTGIFQFEGRATRLVGREVRPDNFLELVDINGLSRPGPLFSGTTNEYIEVKHGKRQPVQLHPVIDEITVGTKGTIIYQEQILRALRNFGGLDPSSVHHIRRIISLKLGQAQFEASFGAFAEGAARLHGANRDLAMEVWGRVVTSASYAFVYAHSLAYAVIGYWAMYLKVNYPDAFYAAQLRKIAKENWPRLIKDAGKRGIEVLGVTPGLSETDWSAQSGRVVAGWRQLNGVGPVMADSILEYQESHGIRRPEDLLNVKGVGAKTFEKFADQLGTADPFGLLKVKKSLDSVREALRFGDIPLRMPTHTSDEILDVPGDSNLIWLGLVKLKEYKDIIEDTRARTGADIEDIKRTLKRPDLVTSCVLHAYDDGDEDVYVRITRFDYAKFKRALEGLRPGHDVVYVRARKSNGGFGASIYVKDLVIIDPEDD